MAFGFAVSSRGIQVGLGLVVVWLLGGCSGADSESNEDFRADYLVTSTQESGGMTAAEVLQGTLIVSPEGCVRLKLDNGQTPLLWAPVGSQLRAGGAKVEIVGFGTYALGDRVELEGVLSEIGPPIRMIRPNNYAECVPKSERLQLLIAGVATPS